MDYPRGSLMTNNTINITPYLKPLLLAPIISLASMSLHAVQLDVLLVYDNDTDDFYNGSPQTAFRAMVDQTNIYYERSNVDLQLNIVGMELVNNVDPSTGSMRSSSTITRLREDLGADFVSYIYNGDGFSPCGVGTLGVTSRAGFNVVKRSCMSRSFAHELGHNMGLGHSEAQDSRGARYSWARGYGVDGVFSTIMAYNSAYNVRSRTYMFSNPDTTCSGLPCGEAGVADAALALNNVKNDLANYTDSVSVTPTPIATPSPTETPTPSSAGVQSGIVNFEQEDSQMWHSVRFSTRFTTEPVVVMGPISFNGGDPATIRIRDVTNEGFMFQLDEWDYLEGSHTSESVSWLAVTPGEHNWGGLNVYAASSSDFDHNWKSVSFGDNINTTPVVLAQKEISGSEFASVVRMRNSSSNGIQFRFQEEEANNDWTPAEVLNYIAITPGTGNINGKTIEAGLTPDAVTDDWYSVDFGGSFDAVLGAIQSYDGGDPAALRMDDTGNSGTSFKIEEEASLDSETTHVTETVGWLVIDD